MIDCSSGDAFGVLSCQFWNTVLQCGVRLPIHTLLDRVVSGAFFLASGVLNCGIHIVDLWQCCVCCTRSGVTRFAHFVALYLCRMCQSGLHAVFRSHIGIVICVPAAEPRSTAGLIHLSVSLWNDLVDPVFDGVGLAGFKSRSNAFLLA